MQLFVDTSGFFAAADRDDIHHEPAAGAFAAASSEGRPLVTHSMVVTETAALMQRRLGHSVALSFLDSLGAVEVVWIDRFLMSQGLERFRLNSPARLSLVDCVSFEVMAMFGMKEYIGFDSHFEREGYSRVTQP